MTHVSFQVPQVTTGKTQLLAYAEILGLYRQLAMAKSSVDFVNIVKSVLKTHREFFEAIFKSTKSVQFFGELERNKISPSNQRLIFERLFSFTQRGAGSNLAGIPFVTLHDDFNGIKIVRNESFDRTYEGSVEAGGTIYPDSCRLTGWHFKIGQPYASRMTDATAFISAQISKFAAAMLSREPEWSSRDVDVVTEWVLCHFEELFLMESQGVGRILTQMDYFLLPPTALRRAILEAGSFSGFEDQLEFALSNGEYRLTTFDISGGVGGAGLTELISDLWTGQSSGHFDAYINAAIGAFYAERGCKPVQILIVPRTADLSILSVEYEPLRQKLLQIGYQAHIVPMESFQACKTGETVLSLHGIEVRFDLEDTLVLKRFTYLGEGIDGHRGFIPWDKTQYTVLPRPASRIVASDKRVNLRLTNKLEPQLSVFGMDVIPCLFTTTDSTSALEISNFLINCSEFWPEVLHLGGVLKTFDKVPGRGQHGEIVSAYPIPAAPFSEETMDIFVKPLLKKLNEAGVGEVVIMPNVLTLLPYDGSVAPKTEIKMMGFYQSEE